MKNLMVYVTPHKKFNEEYSLYARIQIDNSLELGCHIDDLMLVTNFPYEYNGVKAILVADDNFCPPRPRSIKTSIIPHLVEIGLVKEGEVYWNHDLDAWQMNPMDEHELQLNGCDMGLTDYGWKTRWSMGSYFFKESSKDIFAMTHPIIHSDIEDEDAIQQVQDNNLEEFNQRHKRLNITYNMGQDHVEYNYQMATKPIRVVHIHVWPKERRIRNYHKFLYGNNRLGMPIINDRLKAVFSHHGIK